ncbi:MAG: hypothetical protein J1E29_08525 [Duncaniella sp.]|nr:hypothetical protein [Duncaniella sp.]
MTKTSTLSPSLTSVISIDSREQRTLPRRSTIDRIRQAARVYSALATTIPVGGMILN